jgi:hypothetical protein
VSRPAAPASPPAAATPAAPAPRAAGPAPAVSLAPSLAALLGEVAKTEAAVLGGVAKALDTAAAKVEAQTKGKPDAGVGEVVSDALSTLAQAAQAASARLDPQPNHGSDPGHPPPASPPPVSPPIPPAPGGKPDPQPDHGTDHGHGDPQPDHGSDHGHPPPPPPVSPPPPAPPSPPPVSPPPPTPAPPPGPDLTESRALVQSVLERVHEAPVDRYPAVPFSKRQTPSEAHAAHTMLVARTSRLQLGAMRSVLRAQSALPLMQQLQMQAYRFEPFSASSYRARFSTFGRGWRV